MTEPVWIGWPLAVSAVVARRPTVVVGVGGIVASPAGIELEVVGGVRRILGDRPRRQPMNELLVASRVDGGRAVPLHGGAGSGGRIGFRQTWRGGPVPAAGDLTLLVSLPSHDVVEAPLTLDGEALREAAARAERLWAG